MSRLRGFDDFDHAERAEIVWVASEKRQMMFMSLSGDPEIVIARTPATSRSLHNGREQPERTSGLSRHCEHRYPFDGTARRLACESEDSKGSTPSSP